MNRIKFIGPGHLAVSARCAPRSRHNG